jgi:hypothetical protein
LPDRFILEIDVGQRLPLSVADDERRVELVGEFELKGIRRPLAAYNVLGTEPAN